MIANTIRYPKILTPLFDALLQRNIKPVIVGGFVRDALLHKKSKDIDIELYGVKKLQDVTTVLEKFGSLNSVGKSFGVLKLQYKNLELDFSLPREDSKSGLGHKDFHITTHQTLPFSQAAKRRDFTMNAMGFDISSHKLLDPFHGRQDLKNNILRAVDLEHFDEDPLRVLRVIVFAARFELQVDEKLFTKAKDMIASGVLQHLPKERIFTEFEKLFLRSKHPSLGIQLLRDLGGFAFFDELQTLTNKEFDTMLATLDSAVACLFTNTKEKLALFFALVCRFCNTQQHTSFMKKLTNDKTLLQLSQTLHTLQTPQQEDNYTLYKLANTIKLHIYLCYLQAQHHPLASQLYTKAKTLGILESPLPPLMKGKDLLSYGLQPSQEFTKILNHLYELQMQEKIITKEDGYQALNAYLK